MELRTSKKLRQTAVRFAGILVLIILLSYTSEFFVCHKQPVMSILIERDQKELKKCLKYCLKGTKEFTHKLGVIFENQ